MPYLFSGGRTRFQQEAEDQHLIALDIATRVWGKLGEPIRPDPPSLWSALSFTVTSLGARTLSPLPSSIRHYLSLSQRMDGINEVRTVGIAPFYYICHEGQLKIV